MVHLPYLQSFEDVNKRVTRMAANIPFIRGNLSPLSSSSIAISGMEAELAISVRPVFFSLAPGNGR